jgi:hypothetical protein
MFTWTFVANSGCHLDTIVFCNLPILIYILSGYGKMLTFCPFHAVMDTIVFLLPCLIHICQGLIDFVAILPILIYVVMDGSD